LISSIKIEDPAESSVKVIKIIPTKASRSEVTGPAMMTLLDNKQVQAIKTIEIKLNEVVMVFEWQDRK